MSVNLIKNSLANLLGGVVPAIVTLVTIPYIVHQLGDLNFGVLTMVTAIMGYFAVLDLNVTSGSVKYVSEYHAVGNTSALNQTLTFGAFFYLVIGLVGMLLLYFAAEPLASNLFQIPETLMPIVIKTLELVSIGFLLGQLQSYAQSIPQSLQRYDISAKVEIAFGILIPVFTVILLWIGYGLYEIVLLRVLASAANLLIFAVLIRRLLPEFRYTLPSRSVARSVGSFSGFAYLKKVASISSSNLDKLIIGAISGPALVTLYTIPFTLVGRILAMTFRLTSVVFPAASALKATGDMARLEQIYLGATRYLFAITTFIVLLLLLFSDEILLHWIGPQYVDKGQHVLELIALAMLFDSTTVVPSQLNDGFGHPKITGIFAIARAVVSLLLLIPLLKLFGIVGAAAAQALASALFASLFLYYVHKHTIPYSLGNLIRHAFIGPLMIGIGLYVCYVLVTPSGPLSMVSAIGLGFTVSIVYAAYAYRFVLMPNHRQRMHAFFRAAIRLGR